MSVETAVQTHDSEARQVSDSVAPRAVDWNNPRVAAILTAAAKCFARKGFSSTTLAEIGKELGLRKEHRPLLLRQQGGADPRGPSVHVPQVPRQGSRGPRTEQGDERWWTRDGRDEVALGSSLGNERRFEHRSLERVPQ
jgi:hypothetical protein